MLKKKHRAGRDSQTSDKLSGLPFLQRAKMIDKEDSLHAGLLSGQLPVVPTGWRRCDPSDLCLGALLQKIPSPTGKAVEG